MPQQVSAAIEKKARRGITQRILFAISAGWLKKAVVTVVNLVQFPLLYHYLSDDVLGLWFLMIGAQMFMGVFDFGLGQTLQRRIAFAKGSGGADPDLDLDESTKQNIRNLLTMSQRVYSILSLTVFLGLWFGGLIYFRIIELEAPARESLHMVWFIMALGYAANMWGWYVESTLKGLGDIGYTNVINSVLGLLQLLSIWIVFVFGGGLLALAVIWVMKGISQRFLGWKVIINKHTWIKSFKGKWQGQEFMSMIRPALQWWIAIVGTFLLSGMNRYFIGGYLSPRDVPDFVAALTLLSMISTIPVEIVAVTIPLISQMWKAEIST